MNGSGHPLAAELERAAALMRAGRYGEAARAYEGVLAHDASLVAAWINLAGACLQASEFEGAAAACARALALAPGDARALNNQGVALNALNRPGEALAAFDAALATAPGHVNAWVNRGASLIMLGRADDALASFAQALALKPGDVEALYYQGQVLHLLNRQEDALASFDAALAGAPGDADVLYSKGMALLAFRRWDEAWPLYRQRWQARKVRMSARHDRGEPEWDGARGGAVRVWAEQGVGDQILFSRFFHALLARAEVAALECDERLAPLFARTFPAFKSVGAIGSSAQAAAQIAMGDVPALLGATQASIAAAPLLRVDADRRAAARARYEALAGGRKIVGVSWFSQNAEFGAQKSTGLADWGALLGGGHFFVNLQYKSDAGEIAAAGAAFGCAIHSDPDIDQVRDLDGFAAQIAALDCLVSVSNSGVHMAGAIGAPCLLLAPPARGLLWYWGLEGARTPFYDSVTIVRRPAGAPWAGQVAEAAALLAERLRF